MRFAGSWYALGGPVRCVDGTLYRHDPQHDDPDYETNLGVCPECDGHGCDEDSRAFSDWLERESACTPGDT